MEFYTLVCREFLRADWNLWRAGFYMSPLSFDTQSSKIHKTTSSSMAFNSFPISTAFIRVCCCFVSARQLTISGPGKPSATDLALMEQLGRFFGKAVADSRVLDMSFNPCFLMWLRGEEKHLSLKHIKASLCSFVSLVTPCSCLIPHFGPRLSSSRSWPRKSNPSTAIRLW